MTAKGFRSSNWLLIVPLLLVVGCMSERSSQIPGDAGIFNEGNGVLSFTASAPGTVYVYNRNTDKVIYSGPMDRGQNLTVDPDKERITVDGRTVTERDMKGGDTRRVFFKPNP